MAKSGTIGNLGRLVVLGLGSALVAAVIAKFGGRTDRDADGRAFTATRHSSRNRPTVTPPDSDPPDRDSPDRDLQLVAGEAIARPEMPTGRPRPTEPAQNGSAPDPHPPATDLGVFGRSPAPVDNLAATAALAAQASTNGHPHPPTAPALPVRSANGAAVQAAVETAEIDLSAWADPPIPQAVALTAGTEPTGSASIFDRSGEDGHLPGRPNRDPSADADADAAAAAAPAPDAQTGVFYGWILVAAVFVILCITSGVGFYNASVILAAATRELDASVGAVSGATGLFFAVNGLAGYAFAKRLEQIDIRWFFVSGGLIGGAALLGLRWVGSVPALYLFFALFGVGFGLASLVPATTLVTRWFDRRRSVALSVASTGLSVGGIVVTPFSDWLIDQRTLSGAAPYLALLWVVGIIPLAVLLLRSYPSDMGLGPDGDPLKTDSGSVAAAADLPGLAFLQARTTRFFLALCVAYAAIYFGQVGGIAQLFNMILERTDAPTARTALAALAGSSVVFRLIGGAAATRLPTRQFSAALAGVQAVALILLATTDSSAGLILCAAFFGCSIGNLLMLQPLLLAEAFGVANYGRIYSFNQLFGTIGLAVGPLAMGLIRDSVDYRAAFFAAAAASFIGGLAIVAAGPVGQVQALWQRGDRDASLVSSPA